MKHIKLFENFDNKSIHMICLEYNINKYKINTDGSVDVNDNVDLSNKKLKQIPIKFGKVKGWFDCSGNELTNLVNGPLYIGGSYFCNNNNLSDFEGSPITIGANFICDDNPLESLIGLVTEVKPYNHFDMNGKVKIIYEILKDNLEYINNFYDFNILTDLKTNLPKLNLKRLNRFIELYDLEELSKDKLFELKNYYNVI